MEDETEAADGSAALEMVFGTPLAEAAIFGRPAQSQRIASHRKMTRLTARQWCDGKPVGQPAGDRLRRGDRRNEYPEQERERAPHRASKSSPISMAGADWVSRPTEM